MNQAIVYCLVHQTVLSKEEQELILKAVFTYSIWKTPSVHGEVKTEADKIITTTLPKSTYNIAKETSWLATEWPTIEQYLLVGDIKQQILNEIETQIYEIEEHSKEEEDILEQEIIRSTVTAIENKIQEYKRRNKELKEALNKKVVHFKDKSKDKAKGGKGKGKANSPKDRGNSSSSAQGGALEDDDSSSSSKSSEDDGNESDR